MRRLKVAYRPEAVADLEELFQYVLRISRSPEVALALVDRVRSRCRRIGDAPYGGRPRDDLEPGLRTVPFEKRAVVAYRVEPSVVRIVNVFYGGRDFEALYPDRQGDEGVGSGE